MAGGIYTDDDDLRGRPRAVDTLGQGLLLACAVALIWSLTGLVPPAGGLWFAGVAGITGLFTRATAYAIAASELGTLKVPPRHPADGRDIPSLIEEMAVDQRREPDVPPVADSGPEEMDEPEGIGERRFVAVLKEQELRRLNGKGV